MYTGHSNTPKQALNFSKKALIVNFLPFTPFWPTLAPRREVTAYYPNLNLDGI